MAAALLQTSNPWLRRHSSNQKLASHFARCPLYLVASGKNIKPAWPFSPGSSCMTHGCLPARQVLMLKIRIDVNYVLQHIELSNSATMWNFEQCFDEHDTDHHRNGCEELPACNKEDGCMNNLRKLGSIDMNHVHCLARIDDGYMSAPEKRNSLGQTHEI